jgi:hypothetical protein
MQFMSGVEKKPEKENKEWFNHDKDTKTNVYTGGKIPNGYINYGIH